MKIYAAIVAVVSFALVVINVYFCSHVQQAAERMEAAVLAEIDEAENEYREALENLEVEHEEEGEGEDDDEGGGEEEGVEEGGEDTDSDEEQSGSS